MSILDITQTKLLAQQLSSQLLAKKKTNLPYQVASVNVDYNKIEFIKLTHYQLKSNQVE